jgi:hypothetical protein
MYNKSYAVEIQIASLLLLSPQVWREELSLHVLCTCMLTLIWFLQSVFVLFVISCSSLIRRSLSLET